MTGRGRGRGDRGDRGGSRGGGDRGGGTFRGARGGDGGFRGARGGGPRGGPPQVHMPANRIVPPPNSEITKLEDTYQKNLSGALQGLAGLSLSDGSRNHPPRPGYGTRGAKVVLYANYFQMVPAPTLVLYRYNVAVHPDKGKEVTGKKLSQVVRLLLQGPYAELQSDIVSDFKSTLISRNKLNTSTFAITYRAEGEDDARPDASIYQVRVEDTGTLSVSELTDYLASTNINAIYTNKLPMIQALNILMSHYAKAHPKITTVGTGKAFLLEDPQEASLGAGLTAIKGFFSSVRVAASRILLNVNVTHGTFYDAVPLEQLIKRYSDINGRNVVKLESFLKKVRVESTHLAKKFNRAGQPIPRVKTIFGFATTNDGLGSEHPPRVQGHGAGAKNVSFFLNESSTTSGTASAVPGASAEPPVGKKKGKGKGKSEPAKSGSSAKGKYITVNDFFESTYNRTIDPNIPVVNVGNRENPVYLPAQVCLVMPGQSTGKRLDPRQTDAMIKFAVQKPFENARNIADNSYKVVGLSRQINPFLTKFGVEVKQGLITVPGRVLTAPEVKYKAVKASVRFGSWNMAEYKFNATASLRDWSYVMLCGGDLGSMHSTVEKFHGALQKVGIAVPKPQRGKIVNPHLGPDDPQSLEQVFQKYPFELLLVILPVKDIQLYNRVKLLGDVRYGVHTVCVVAPKFTKDDPQYFGNVSLKFNLKLGGVNQTVDNVTKMLVDVDKTMLVGIDVTHPSPGSANNTPSVAAIVASIDRSLGQFPADLRIQTGRQEMVADLCDMMKTRLQLWKTLGRHQSFPENILIYRDGVSEGQFDLVLEKELPLIRRACTELYPATASKEGLPKITIVIVGKRHHTRFYPTEVDKADRSSNPNCGTVVDRGVTEPRNWNFFLQAHTAIQGTARPAHYYVILDEIFHKRKIPQGMQLQNTADVLEELTHSMCYMFGRATKAVSICPPAYYADIACERARCYLSRLFNMESQAGSVESGRGQMDASSEDVQIHPRLKNTMFYI